MPEAQVVDSLAAVERGDWQALFGDEPEGYDYLMAVEQAGLEGFRWRYVLVREGGRLIAAAPAFLTEYALETTLTGAGKHIFQGLRRIVPGALTVRLACIGSPCITTVGVGF